MHPSPSTAADPSLAGETHLLEALSPHGDGRKLSEGLGGRRREEPRHALLAHRAQQGHGEAADEPRHRCDGIELLVVRAQLCMLRGAGVAW